MDRLVVDVTAPHRAPDELYIEVGGMKLGGWERVEVTLRAEAFPNAFAITASAFDPTSGAATAVTPGAPCTVYLGDDQVVTGYVDRRIDAGTADTHELTIFGRGKTQDLVDCSAEWPTGQVIQGNAFSIASKLAEPYGIIVALGAGVAEPPPVPSWALSYGETGADIIQRLARNAGLLAYEDSRGVLILDRAGSTAAASGAVYGENVQGWEATLSVEDRVASYTCTTFSVDGYADFKGGGSPFFFTAPDPGARAARKRYLTLEPVPDPQQFVQRKALWEAARNAGRGAGARVTLDSWRDAAGALWRPNTLLPIDIPGMAAASLVIAEVAFRRSEEEGTTANIYALPKLGLEPEPLSLQVLAAAGLHA